MTIIAAPAHYGQPKPGVELGPAAILGDGALEASISTIAATGPGRRQIWHDVKSIDLAEPFESSVEGLADSPVDGVKKPRSVGAVTQVLADKVIECTSENRFVLMLGGDHALALGSIGGMLQKHPNLAVLWVDAHADINTPSTTDTGNLHGCPVSFLLGLDGTKGLPGFGWRERADTRFLPPSRLAYIGLRDVDQAEKDILAQHGIVAFSMSDIVEHGIAKIVTRAFRAIDPHGDRPIHLSFDIDALDPMIAPATGTPVPGGLLEREGRYICEVAAATRRLVSMDLVEVNPTLDEEKGQNGTVRAACHMILAALGGRLL